MSILGLDINNLNSENYSENSIALGNYIAENYIQYGLLDGSNEQDDYENQFYSPVNEPLTPIFSGNPSLTNPNRWQPLTLDVFVFAWMPFLLFLKSLGASDVINFAIYTFIFNYLY